MTEDIALFRSARTEIEDAHDFFAHWFRGAGGADAFAARAKAFHADFTMVTPDGRLIDRTALLARIEAMQGARDSDFVIDVEAADPLWHNETAVLVTYIEAQAGHGPPNARRATALFEADAAAPNGVVWRHVHETWLER